MVGKRSFKVVFVVLVYKNVKDLEEFFQSFKCENSKVIVVNSFYDEETEKSFRIIAENNKADFITVPNKGYGAGNNAGCKYALNTYSFEYLVISNADITIEKFNVSDLSKYKNVVIAPKILNMSGKNQNPSAPFYPCIWMDKFKYWIFKGNHKKLIWLTYIWSRIKKTIYYGMSSYKKTIFSAHGSFLIIPQNVLVDMFPLYDERMFLFVEEEHLGQLTIAKGYKTIYAPEIIIRHKEDGSMNLSSVNVFERAKQSYFVYYSNWVNK